MIYEILLEVLTEDGQDVKGIYERNDIKVRAKEGLPLEKGYWRNINLPTTTIINENEMCIRDRYRYHRMLFPHRC